MENEEKSILEKLNTRWVTPLFAVIAIIYGFIFKVTSDRVDQNTRNLNNLKIQIDNQLRQKEFDNNLKMTIYQEVKEAIKEKNDSALQNATLIVVNEMLKDDSLFKEKLKTVLFASTNSKKLIATQQKIDQFSVEQTSTPVNGFRIDIFYLDNILAEAKPRAEKIQRLLQSRFPQYKTRLRLLPKEINAQTGYRIDANQVRFESGEKNIADEVLNAIVREGIFQKEQPIPHLTSNSTPNYISIFVRNM